MWGEPSAADKDDLWSRVKDVAALLKMRLHAEFPRDDVRTALSIFDRRRVRQGWTLLPCAPVRHELVRGLRLLAQRLGVNETAALLQYNDVAPWVVKNSEPGEPLATCNNQTAWASLLDPETWDQATGGRLDTNSPALRTIIRFYICLEDGECTVERDLATLRGQKSRWRPNEELLGNSRQ